MDNTKKPLGDPEMPTAEKSKLLGHSKIFIFTVAGLLELILLIGVFALGMRVGFHKANFTCSWERNYPENFNLPGRRLLLPPPPGSLFNAHGVFGIILSKDQTKLVIKDQDNTEKTVVVSDGTTIRRNFDSLTANDLKAGQQIVVIGEANSQGQIEAKLIRVLN